MNVERATDAWIERPSLDYAFSALASVAALVFDADVSIADHGAFYQTLVTLSLGLFFIGSIAITILFAVAPNERLDRLQASVGYELQRLIVSSIGGLLLATAGFTSLFALDQSSHNARFGVATASVAVCSLRAGRLWWVLRRLLAAATLDRRVEVDLPKWAKPDVQAGDYHLEVARPRSRRGSSRGKK
jgi:hypothetical protein